MISLADNGLTLVKKRTKVGGMVRITRFFCSCY